MIFKIYPPKQRAIAWPKRLLLVIFLLSAGCGCDTQIDKSTAAYDGLLAYVNSSDHSKIDIRIDKTVTAEEIIEFTINSQASGFLTVIVLKETELLGVLFPNDYSTTPQFIDPEQTILLPDNNDWQLRAMSLPGRYLLVTALTEQTVEPEVLLETQAWFELLRKNKIIHLSRVYFHVESP